MRKRLAVKALGVFAFLWLVFLVSRAADVVLPTQGRYRSDAPPPTPAKGAPPAAVFITFLDYFGPLACASLRNAAACGVPLRVVGPLPGSSETEKDPKRRKVAAVAKFLDDMAAAGADDRTLVFFSDGTDMLYAPDARAAAPAIAAELLDAEEARAAGASVVLFGGERNCWPFMDGDRELRPGGRQTCARLAGTGVSSSSASSFVYINAGNWVARRRAAATLMAAWQAAMERPDQREHDDQSALQALALEGGAPGVALRVDRRCRLFQTGWGTKLERGGWDEAPVDGRDRAGPYLRRRAPPDDAAAISGAGVGGCDVVNTETGTRPLFAHFNGDKAHFVSAVEFCSGPAASGARRWGSATTCAPPPHEGLGEDVCVGGA